MRSILQGQKECWFCGQRFCLESHHIFHGPNRKVSERLGLKVWLCREHHRGRYGAHFDRDTDLQLKKAAQMAYELKHSREEFMKEIGRNYL